MLVVHKGGSAVERMALPHSHRRPDRTFELGFHNDECKHYWPTQFPDFRTIMRALGIEPHEHVFLDYGAGMGRSMILAARYPFRRVLGVEISPELAEIAKKNFHLCRLKLKCRDIEIIICDASQFDPPADVTVFYFNNPFFGKVLTTVLHKLHRHADAACRPFLLVCNVTRKSAFEQQIRAENWLAHRQTILLSGERHCLIFTTVASRIAGAKS